MSKNIDQVYIANPITSNASTDLMYFGQSPYGPGNDAAMTYSNFNAQFATTYLPLSGGTMSGILNMNSNKISNVTDPTNPQDAATKNYADTIAAGLNPIDAAYAASTANLAGYTYLNGAAGVGATLTAGSNGVFTVDGVSPPVGSRFLYKNDTTGSGAYNGIYTVTTSTGGSPAVLTRSTDYNTPSQIQVGDLISVENGTANAGSSWYQTATVVTIGVSAISFSAFFTPANYLQVTNNLSDVNNKTTSFNNISPLTTKGDLIGYSTQNVRLAVGSTNGQVLQVASGGATGLAWSTPTYPSASGSSGKVVVSDGTNNVYSTPTFPNASATSRKIIVSDGTNWVASTETYAVPGSSGNVLTSDGTNWTSAAPVVSTILTTKGDILGYTTTEARVPVAVGDGKVLQVSSGASAGIAYSTPTYPSASGSTGTILRSDGTNNVYTTATYPNTTTINNILFSSAANTISQIAAANSGVLVSSSAGVPSMLAAGTTGQVLQASSSGTPSWSTPTYPSASGSAGVILRSDGTNYVATTATYPSSTTVSQLLYSSASNVVGGLTTANGGVLVTSNTGVPSVLAGSGTTNTILQATSGGTPAWSTATYPATTTINQILYSSSANTVAGISAVNSAVLSTSAGGVPSLSTTLPSGIAATNMSLTSPALGTPSSGTLTNCTGLPVAGGGTGNSTFTAYSVICAGTTSTGIFQNVSGVGSSGQVLTSAGASALPTWSNVGYATVDQASSSVTMAVNTQYVVDNGASLVTLTLPATAAQGSFFKIRGLSSGGWKVGQAASQTCHLGSSATTAGTGGSLASTNQYDCLDITCVTANTTFVVNGVQGNITVV